MLLGVVDKLGETLQAPEDTPNRLGADVSDPLIVGLVHEDLIWKGQASGCPVRSGLSLILYTNDLWFKSHRVLPSQVPPKHHYSTAKSKEPSTIQADVIHGALQL